MKTEPLAIVGIGCLFPKADGPGAYWANVRDGVDGIGDIPGTHWNPDDYFDPDPKRPDMTYARRGGFLEPVAFNPLEFGIAPRDLEATDTSQLLGLVAAKRALDDAKVRFTDKGGTTDRNRVSVILGVTGTLELVIPLGARLGHPRWKKAMQEAGIPDDAAADACQRIADSYVPWQENSFPGLLGNVVAGRIANRLDLGGTNCVVDAACASSLSAVHLAALELQAGRADVAVTGGVDTFNDIFMFMCFSKTPALSPTGDARPFDADGDGTALGEGVGVVVLKRLSDAERDGDRVYAVIKSIGSSSDGKGTAIYAPSAAGQQKALRTAYELAGVSPDTIELVEAHGTGTKVGDAVEASALAEVYGKTGSARVAIGSVKSMIGHTKAAAGAASLIKTALALHYKTLPPTLKVKSPVGPLAAADSPFYVSTEKRPWLPHPDHPRRAALSAFGFGGSNFHAVLEEHTGTKQETDWDGSVEILAISGATADAVKAALDKVPGEWTKFATAAEASRQTFSPEAPCRLVLVAHRTRTDLGKLLAGAKAELAAKPATEWHTPDGASYGIGAPAGTVGVLFPGQGSQAVGMLRDLACQFPELLDTLAEANDPLPDGRRVTDVIYPPKSFAPDAAETQQAALTSTDVAQPALGAVSFGAWRLLSSRFGLEAAAFAGHSYGELPALAAAGRITSEDLFTLSRKRGQLMKEAAAGNAGSMLAVVAPLADIEATIEEAGLKVVVANQNSPTQTVLSGATTDIDAAAAAFKAKKVKAVRLPVAAAFHSPLVAQASWPFREALRDVRFSPDGGPVYANTTAGVYPDDGGLSRDLLGGQLARPVRFADTVRNMAEAGVRTFVEVGPGGVLTKLAEATLAETSTQSFLTVAIAPSGGKRPGVLELAGLLAKLSARGHVVRLSAWEAGSRCRPAPEATGMTVPVGGANLMTPRPARPIRPPLQTLAGTESSPPQVLPPAETAMTPAAPGPDGFAQALSLTQQTLTALQQLQEQTARLHQQFLESQEQAQRTLFALVGQQQALLNPGAVPAPLPAYTPSPPPPAPVVALPPAPAPAVVSPPPPVAVVKPAVPTPATPSLAAKPAAPAPGSDIEKILLEVVAEKTGYPAGLLDPGMQLDADLGVDSIKRVEILSALQDRLPHAPAVKPEHLGALHTLRDIAAFLAAGAPEDGPTTVAMTTLSTLGNLSDSALVSFNGPAAEAVQDMDAVEKILLEVVAEKTGYPAGLLDPGMQLDADLGVDSIKRVEILSALQDRLPHAPAVKPEHLGALHTLRDIAAFLATPANGPATTVMRVAPVTPPRTDDGPPSSLLWGTPPTGSPAPGDAPPTQAISVRPTTVPPETSDLLPQTFVQPVSVLAADTIDRSLLQAVDLDLSAPRPRLALPPGGEVWVVGPDDALTAGVCDQLTAQRVTPRRFPWVAPEDVHPSGRAVGLVLIAPARTAATTHLNRLAYRWLQVAGPLLRSAGKPGTPTLLATVARLDGAFGLSDLDPAADPLPGGLAGLVKTAKHEWPEVSAKAIDVHPGFAAAEAAAAAAAVAEELLSVGPLEVGIAATHRSTLELARSVRRPAATGPVLGPTDVVLVTGGGRGVTAEVAVALAQAFRCTLVLTGRTPPPAGPEPVWLAGLTDEAAMKAAITSHLGTTAGPKAVGDFYAKTQAQREVGRTVRRCEQAGAKVAYLPVNAANGRQVADLIHQVTVKHGPVTALVHGAGVLADKRIEDLTPDQFDAVYSTKVDGLRTLLELLAHQELKALVLFGSTTGRLGRVGQLAYACANEVLNKIAQVESRKRPACKVVAVNWGPWEGGMVTPGLRRVFEAEGVGLIPLSEGGLFAVHELGSAGRAVEVVALGKPAKPSSGRMPAIGASAAPPLTPTPANPPAAHPPLNQPPAELRSVFERTLDVDHHPVLRSHVLDGRAVLPMALHLELLAHAALHGNPGLVFHGFNDLRIIAGAMVEEGGSMPLRALAGKAVKQDRLFVVPVELRGKRRDGRDALHSRAEIVLTAALPKPPAADPLPTVQPYPHPVEEVYQYFLFHGPDLHGIERVDGVSETAFVGTAYPAPQPGEWLAQPLRTSWVADPLVLDASFQMMILWSFVQHGAGSLPCFAGRYRQYRRAFPAGPAKVVIRVTRDNGSFARADIDYLDPDGGLVAQVQDYECVIDRQLDAAFRRNQLAPKQPV